MIWRTEVSISQSCIRGPADESIGLKCFAAVTYSSAARFQRHRLLSRTTTSLGLRPMLQLRCVDPCRPTDDQTSGKDYRVLPSHFQQEAYFFTGVARRRPDEQGSMLLITCCSLLDKHVEIYRGRLSHWTTQLTISKCRQECMTPHIVNRLPHHIKQLLMSVYSWSTSAEH